MMAPLLYTTTMDLSESSSSCCLSMADVGKSKQQLQEELLSPSACTATTVETFESSNSSLSLGEVLQSNNNNDSNNGDGSSSSSSLVTISHSNNTNNTTQTKRNNSNNNDDSYYYLPHCQWQQESSQQLLLQESSLQLLQESSQQLALQDSYCSSSINNNNTNTNIKTRKRRVRFSKKLNVRRIVYSKKPKHSSIWYTPIEFEQIQKDIQNQVQAFISDYNSQPEHYQQEEPDMTLIRGMEGYVQSSQVNLNSQRARHIRDLVLQQQRDWDMVAEFYQEKSLPHVLYATQIAIQDEIEAQEYIFGYSSTKMRYMQQQQQQAEEDSESETDSDYETDYSDTDSDEEDDDDDSSDNDSSSEEDSDDEEEESDDSDHGAEYCSDDDSINLDSEHIRQLLQLQD